MLMVLMGRTGFLVLVLVLVMVLVGETELRGRVENNM